MSAPNFTPIQLYRTATAAAAPSAGNLADGELAINLTDEKLYFKNASGVVKLLASNSGSLGSVTSVNASGSTTGLTFTGGPITSSGTLTLGGTLVVANGGTGTSTQFTAGSVVFAGASGVYTQDNANLFWDNANDRLGIGTATPSAKLSVVGTAKIGEGAASNTSKLMVNTVSGVAAGIQLFQDGNESWVIENPASTNALTFANSGTERMRITGAGDVLVGKTAASVGADGVQLLAAGYSGFSAAGTTALFLNRNTNDGTILEFGRNGVAAAAMGLTSSALTFGTAGSERMRITGTGDVGIGTTDPTSILQASASSSSTGLAIAGPLPTLALYDNNGTTGTGFIAQVHTDTYVYNKESGNLLLGTTNTERMRITGAGNVGIGTSSPLTKLHVDVNSSTANYALIGNASNGIGVGVQADGSPTIFNYANKGIIFGGNYNTGLTEQMRIDATGNVGIGTSSPSVKLEVNGSVRFVDSSAAGPDLLFGNVGGGTSINNVANARTYIGAYETVFTNYDNSSEWMRIDSSGNVGIGGSSSGARLQINTASSNSMRLYNTAGNGTIIDFVDQGWQSQIAGNAGTILFNTGGTTERMRIDATGNVGIGTSSPTAYSGYTSLEIDNASNGGILSIKKAGSVVGYLNGVSGLLLLAQSNDLKLTTTGSTSMQFSTNATERMRIDGSGNVLVGATGGGSAGLAVGVGLNISFAETAGQSYATIFRQGSSGGLILGSGVAYTSTPNGFASSTSAAWARSAVGVMGGGIKFYTAPTATVAVGTDTTLTERMFIDASGNVGIGTSSPTSFGAGATMLTVAGTSAYGGYLGATTTVTVQLWANEGGLEGTVGTRTNHPLTFTTNNTERMRITADGNLQLGTASLATNATNGFPYIPTCAGTPTGTPTAITGYAPMVVDSTNNKLYVYVGGAWQAMN